jgi:hypothetical protein
MYIIRAKNLNFGARCFIEQQSAAFEQGSDIDREVVVLIHRLASCIAGFGINGPMQPFSFFFIHNFLFNTKIL